MEGDDVQADLLRRASALHRRAVAFVVAIALLVAAGAVYLTVADRGQGGVLFGKVIGLTGGLTFVAAFLTTLLLGLHVAYRFLVARVRRWAAEAVRAHRLEEGSLDYLVEMYAVPSTRSPAHHDDT
ncbi:MAG: hypothetical protein KIT84_33965 [Labilithrix sp.]|nr:hypothetical protein [Labilithrix sp.]MCW5816054.1 hypothetical protein [Labilithrix sp.]